MYRGIFATVMLNITLIFPCVSADKEAYITREDCQRLIVHKPNADVAYQAGVDVRGKAVKPADLETDRAILSGLGVKDQISFHLILDIAQHMPGNKQSIKPLTDQKGLRGEIYLGQVIIKDGVATLNGQPLAPAHQKQLYVICDGSRNKPD